MITLGASREMIVDNFAGGGGASTGIEIALGRSVDVAINHDPAAVAMQTMNHPRARHFVEDVFAVDPREVTGGAPVGFAWFSPDCTHFSKAKGGVPRDKNIRGLAWVAVRWASLIRPRVIALENVEEFEDWGPLLEDGRPDAARAGETFGLFCQALRDLGYRLECRILRASEFGAATLRKRLFLVARCDGRPIVWPAGEDWHPHAPDLGGRLAAVRPAASVLDFSLPCPSIFLSREEGRTVGCKRPLAEATMRRIARGVRRYVLDAAEPFIVPLTHQGSDRVESIAEPMRTITAAHRGERALVVPFLTEHANASAQRCFPAGEPLRTQCSEVKGGHFALVAAFLAKHYGDRGQRPGSDCGEAMDTITATDHHALVTSHLMKLNENSIGQDLARPFDTVMAGATRFAEVRAFLVKYYGTGEGADPREPLHTVTARDRMGLVTVRGTDYAIADIGMRMLMPRELYRAQGFPEHYVIDHDATGRRFSKKEQVRMVGNSVCPPVAAALAAANVPELSERLNLRRAA